MNHNKQSKKKHYFSIDELILFIEEPERSKFLRLFQDNKIDFKEARGSTSNHQAWSGGYLDNIQEAMNIAFRLYDFFNTLRPLPFSRSDVLIVIFSHDLEKPWKYEKISDRYQHKNALKTKQSHHDFRIQKLKEYKITLTSEQENAVRYAEGELADYTNKKRVMGPLGAFCHICDITSARLWFNYPLKQNDPWSDSATNQD